MKFYFIGIAMRSYQHDYSDLHALLSNVDARRVSKRIWLASIKQQEDEIFHQIGKSLSSADELLIVEVPGKQAGPTPANMLQSRYRRLPAPSRPAELTQRH